MISWIHFGDLHITGPGEQNYRDFAALVDEANRNMRAGIDFALLPGDKADDGEEDEYELVQQVVAQCRFPVHAIPGDHDAIPGGLDLFLRYLSPEPYGSFTMEDYRFLCLNSVAVWKPPIFGLGPRQMDWLRDELRSRQRVVVFMHAYPSEHGEDAVELQNLFRESGVLLVEMGHTHYNELVNDGHMLFATTRSTGQVEEGPPGFSVTTLDEGCVSWKFKPLGEWPLVMITSPADERLIVDAAGVLRGPIPVRARVWGEGIENVTLAVGEEEAAMQRIDDCTWSAVWDSTKVANGSHKLTVSANGSYDRIQIAVNQEGRYHAQPGRVVDPERHLLGTQLGPNANGRHWPRKRDRAAQ